MTFKIILQNEHEILGDDGHLACGYFELEENDFSINFFKDRSCMVFLTLYSICDFLSNNKKELRWVGEDNGKFFILTKQKDKIVVTSKEFEVKFKLNSLIDAIKNCLFDFMAYCKILNNDIVNQGGFSDLEMSFNKL